MPIPCKSPDSRGIRTCGRTALAAALVLARPASAEPSFSFADVAVVPLSADTRSVRVLRRDEPLYAAPSTEAAKRGAALAGALLPVFGARRGEGCAGRWFQVGPYAFVCEEGAEPSAAEAPALDQEEPATGHGLPYQYHFVSPDGSFGYRQLETAEEGVPDAQFQPGFGIAVEHVAHRTTGDPFGLTSRGFWVPMRDLSPATPVHFEGNAYSDDLAWVVRDNAPVFDDPASLRRKTTLERLTAVKILDTRVRASRRYHRIGEDAWVQDRDVARAAKAEPPEGIRNAERWIDIDLERQIAVAYKGGVPWFATLVTTGRGPSRSESATPEGTFRIWVKLKTSDMDNLENLEARENYAIEAVPWVMFFHRGYGLHGTFWHRRFGEVRSHGCVNLSPRDAERLFHFTSPRLLPGWSAVFPNPHELGTLVRVRRGSGHR